jgi:inositol transport system substrate-binding protein
MKKIIATVLSAMVITATLAGCSSSQPTSNTASSANNDTAKKTLKIGVSMKDLSDQFVKNIGDAITAEGKAKNVELVTADAQGSVDKQLSDVENFITQKVDAIILNAMDADGSGPAVDAANKAGIPIIECNTLTKNTNYNTYVGSVDDEAGKIQGNFVKEITKGKANVGVLMGPMGQSPQVLRKKGVDESLFTNTPDIKKLAEQTANWKRDQAMSITEDWLQRFPELNVIASQNDDMAMGALQAVEASGKKGIIIVGVDAIPDALQAVKDGKLACTVFQDSKGQGSKSVDVAIQLVNKEKVDKEVMIPFQLVTKDNVDKFIGLNAK